jgi:hypothetical protein
MPSFDQAILSEQLQLLHEFQYSDLQMPYQNSGIQSNKDSRSRDAHSEIRVLDTIAVLLTTGRPGDVTAVALDKHKGLQLVLAKNAPPNHEDDLAAQNLVSLLVNPATIDPEHVFPFLLTHSLQNMNKRLQNLHESLSQLLPEVISFLPQYLPQSVDEELPKSTNYRRYRYKDGEPGITTIITDIFYFCSLQTQSSLNPSDVHASHMTYSSLDLAASVLSRSRFLDTLIRDSSDPMRAARSERLKRRLLKVCQYYSGTAKLISSAKRWFPNGTIPYRWANDTNGREEGTVEISSQVEEAIGRAPVPDIPQEAMELLRQRFPAMFQQWPRFVRPYIHAELRVILDLNPPSSTSAVRQQAQRPIGCSKRSCLCCALWISAFNRIFFTNWMTSGSHGKAYANWALPGAAYAMGQNGKSQVDEAVLRNVEIRLVDTLDWLVSGRRVSDEHRSSEEGSSEEEEFQDRWIMKYGQT